MDGTWTAHEHIQYLNQARTHPKAETGRGRQIDRRQRQAGKQRQAEAVRGRQWQVKASKQAEAGRGRQATAAAGAEPGKGRQSRAGAG